MAVCQSKNMAEVQHDSSIHEIMNEHCWLNVVG